MAHAVSGQTADDLDAKEGAIRCARDACAFSSFLLLHTQGLCSGRGVVVDPIRAGGTVCLAITELLLLFSSPCTISTALE